MRIAMSAEPRLLDLRKFPQEVLVGARSLDNLVGGSRIRRGESGGNRLDHSVIHESKDPPALEIYAQAVRVEEVGAE